MSEWKPWEESAAWKTEASFYAWLRGQLRRSVWSHYPPKNEYKASMLRPATEDDYAKGVSPRTKKVGQCYLCKNWFPASHLQVDHLDQAGSLRCEDDITPFIKNLACMKDNMRLSCKPCHETKTLADKLGITFEQAIIEKKIIAQMKLSKIKQDKVLTELGMPCNNDKVRKESWRKLIEKGEV